MILNQLQKNIQKIRKSPECGQKINIPTSIILSHTNTALFIS